MNLILLGYGKMGQAVEREALARGHQIRMRLGREDREALQGLAPGEADAVIEFTQPEAFMGNLRLVLAAGLPLVSGTTGWGEQQEAVRALVEAHAGTLVHSSNFSPGVNLLFALNRKLAEWMEGYPEYDVFIEEQHHRHKADAPSGTARSLAAQILERLSRKQRLAGEELRQRPPAPEELSIGYVRAGSIVGRHRVSYRSEIDSLSIEHEAFDRRGFALGAVMAAEWMQGRKGMYDFSEIFT